MKKILALAMVLSAFGVVLSGCGSKPEDSGSTTTGGTATTGSTASTSSSTTA